MAISFNNALGVHQYAIGTRAKRAEVIASNIANADTPGYKARGMDFKKALKSAVDSNQLGLSRTNVRHIYASSDIAGTKLFRTPTQPDTGDGNTVDLQLENNLFMQNNLEYQATLDFLSNKFKNLNKALAGGR